MTSPIYDFSLKQSLPMTSFCVSSQTLKPCSTTTSIFHFVNEFMTVNTLLQFATYSQIASKSIFSDVMLSTLPQSEERIRN